MKKVPAYLRGKYKNGNIQDARIDLKCDKVFLFRLKQAAERKKICMSEYIRNVVTEDYLKTFEN